MLAGLGNEERNKLRLTKAADYNYLNKVTIYYFSLIYLIKKKYLEYTKM